MTRRHRQARQDDSSFPDLMSAEMITRQKESLEQLVQTAKQSFQEKQAVSARRD